MSRHGLILIGIMLGGLALRLAGLNSQGLWFDEGLTLAIARWPALDLAFRPVDPTPGLYYLLHKALIPPDAPLIAVRGISLAFGLAAIPLMYVVGRLAYGRTAGLIGAAMLAVATSHVDYSQEARNYSLLVFLTLTAAAGLLRYATAGTAAQRRLGLLLLAAGNVLAFYCQVTAAAFVATSSLVVLVLALRRRLPPGEILVCFAIMAALAAPGLWRLIEQQRVGHSFDWLEQATPEAFVRYLSDAVLPAGLWENPYAVGWRRPIRLGVAALSGAAALLALGRYGRGAFANPVGGLIAAFAAVPALLWAVGLVGPPVVMTRTLLPVLPGVLLAITGIVVQLRRPLPAAAAVGGIYLASTVLMGLQHDQQDLRGAARIVGREAKAGDTVIVCPVAAYPAFRYHAGKPAGSAVLALMYEGELMRLEGAFGSDPAWDETYFENTVRGVFDKRAPTPSTSSIVLPAGSAVFIVEAFCDDYLRAPLMRQLAALGARPETRWRLREWSGPMGDVHVTRLRIGAERTVPVLLPGQPPLATNQPLRKPSAALP